MMHYLEEWLARKGERPQVSICEKRSVRFKFTRPLGPRGQFAVVYLCGEPAEAFAFTSVAEWPGPGCDYTVAVLDGILDELFAVDLGQVAARVQFTLEKIEWHDVDSSAVAFYHAARGAVREILGSDRFLGNIDYRLPTSGRS
jgi:hypothetical protein